MAGRCGFLDVQPHSVRIPSTYGPNDGGIGGSLDAAAQHSREPDRPIVSLLGALRAPAAGYVGRSALNVLCFLALYKYN